MIDKMDKETAYRGRIAPTPSGYLHLGHARTFLEAQQRCHVRAGTLLLRIEDLDQARCKTAYLDAALEDLAWLGLGWQGDVVYQSKRLAFYRETLRTLALAGLVYPCVCSRREVADTPGVRQGWDGDLIYPGACRSRLWEGDWDESAFATNWRFKVPQGMALRFVDGYFGEQCFVGGEDFGDFLVWRKDGFPAYELAVVADDIDQGISEVVRGADLLLSTARQLLLYRALGAVAPAFFHCPLVLDTEGRRLAKSAGSKSLRELRQSGRDWREELAAAKLSDRSA